MALSQDLCLLLYGALVMVVTVVVAIATAAVIVM
jgi:hypothetical protein